MMKMVLDRFEDEFAICEDIETRNLIEYHRDSLPEDAAPGDVLVYDGCVITIDHAETEIRRERIKKMFEAL